MDYEHLTKLMHALRIHKSFISESFTNHIHQTKQAIELLKHGLEEYF